MNKPSWIDRLEKKWNVSTGRVFVILLVFACTGFSVMFLKRPLLEAVGAGNNLWASVIYYLLIFPLYNVILLFYGFLFGQFQFFWEFEKRFFRRIFGKK